MELFSDAYNNWNVEQLCQDLAEVKGKPLTKIEKTHLRGLLCGLSPREIARQREREIGSIEGDISNTIYHYVKILTDHPIIDSYQDIIFWLQEEGYQKICTHLTIPLHIENINALLFIKNPLQSPPPPKFA
jgi:hypothetical protein